MTEPVPRNPILARIDAAAAARKTTRQAIAKAAKLDRGYLQKLEKRGPRASVRADSLIRLADAAGIPRDELLSLAPRTARERQSVTGAKAVTGEPLSPAMIRDVPILGVAAGSAFGAFVISGDPIGYVARPPALQYVPDAYAVYVQNESMSPLHNPGDLRFVHPHKPPRAGDSVVLQLVEADASAQAYIKIFERRSGDWVVCRQTNPAAEIKFKAAQIRAVHRVMTMNELFNA
jgi:phage repressor protein C with HTH and peptisase S24 domain